MTRPILLVGDDPSQSSGLARILRDLATLLSSMPEFRVATLGQVGAGSARFPWTQYHMHTRQEFGELSLPQVWDEFSRGEIGIVMPVWDCTRLTWLARPEFCEVEDTRRWLEEARHKKFQLHAYMPFDATGPGGRFTTIVKETLMGIDRIVVPSPIALDWVVATIGAEEAGKRGAEWLPHGLNLKTWAPRGISNNVSSVSDVTRVGLVCTNQQRKEIALAFAVMAALTERLKGKVKFWIHVDVPERHWSIPALTADFNLGELIEVTHPPADDGWLSEQYRSCDCTFLPSSGEGFGYSLFESLACGTPVVHGDYAGGASLMKAFGLDGLLVAPRAWRVEGVHNCVRPVYAAEDFADRIQFALGIGGKQNVDYAKRVEHLSWMKLGHRWKRWFREGL